MRNGMISAGERQIRQAEERIVTCLIRRQSIIDAIEKLDPKMALGFPTAGEALEDLRLRAESALAKEELQQEELDLGGDEGEEGERDVS